MFAYISGRVASVSPESAVVDVNGVGFDIICDAYTRSDLRKGETATLHVVLRTADDRMTLYGFQSVAQKQMFLRLVAVSGVGPRMALSILSGMRVQDIVTAVVTQDEKAFQAISGVGKKTAQRLMLELKSKIDVSEAEDLGELAGALGDAASSDAASDAVEALEGLGFTRPEAMKAIAGVRNLADTPEELVRFALKRFGAKGGANG